MDELLTALSITGFKAKFENNALSIVYDEASKPYLEKILLDFSNIKGYQIRLASSDGHGEFLFGLKDKEADIKFFARNLKGVLATFDVNVNYKERLSNEVREIYELFLNALKLGGKFGIGIQILEDEKVIIVKTDVEFMIDRLKAAGFSVADGKIAVGEEEIELFFKTLSEINLELNKMLEEKEELVDAEKAVEDDSLEDTAQLESVPTNEDEKEEIILPGETVVDLYDKFAKDKNGQDVIIRMSVIKQSKEDSMYERLVNFSYISPKGQVTKKEVFGYENGRDFDNNVLPSVIDNFHKDYTASGKKVTVNDTNPGRCYVSAGENDDSISLDGYDVDYVNSIVAVDREHNLVGDKNNYINMQDLDQYGVVEEVGDIGPYTIEEEVLGQELDENVDEYEKSNDGKKMVKTLGSDPRAGLVNYAGLIFYFVIDILAIVVGIYFLTR